MKSKTARTRIMTIYRLPDIDPTVDDMFDILDEDQLAEIGTESPEFPDTFGVPAVWVDGCFAPETPAEWCADAQATTGLHIEYFDRRSAGLLLLAVDGTVYALGYGAGHRLIPDGEKDQRFGLSCAVRCIDPEQIYGLVRRYPGARGRTDSTIVPGGLPIWSMGVSEPIDIVRKAGGLLRDFELELEGQEPRTVRIEGGTGLRMAVPTPPRALVETLRTIARIGERPVVDPALQFMDNVRLVGDPRRRAELNGWLDDMLGQDIGEVAQHVAPVVPANCLSNFARAKAIRMKIGTVGQTYHHFALEPLACRTLRQRDGNRVDALKSGRIELYADEKCQERLQGTMALKWIEAAWHLDSRRYFLMDGDWYDVSDRYLDGIHSIIKGVINPQTDHDLPAWDLEWGERRYNEHVQDVLGVERYLCLDRVGVKDKLFRGNGFEACDLLGPDNELIHVKRAKGSAPLSHLFSQALVSTQGIRHSPEANSRFTEVVRQVSKGRRNLPDGFTPKKVVLAILFKKGEPLTPETLFPFSQITLADTVTTLQHSEEIEVEVIGIPSA